MLLHVLYWLPTNDLFLLMRTNKLFEYGCRKILEKRQILVMRMDLFQLNTKSITSRRKNERTAGYQRLANARPVP
jgi:hypothetical protein